VYKFYPNRVQRQHNKESTLVETKIINQKYFVAGKKKAPSVMDEAFIPV
jgi:hypothetical protein